MDKDLAGALCLRVYGCGAPWQILGLGWRLVPWAKHQGAVSTDPGEKEFLYLG